MDFWASFQSVNSECFEVETRNIFFDSPNGSDILTDLGNWLSDLKQIYNVYLHLKYLVWWDGCQYWIWAVISDQIWQLTSIFQWPLKYIGVVSLYNTSSVFSLLVFRVERTMKFTYYFQFPNENGPIKSWWLNEIINWKSNLRNIYINKRQFW